MQILSRDVISHVYLARDSSTKRLADRDRKMYLSITNKMQRYTMIFITTNALHVSGGYSAHHQELKTVYTTSVICRAFTDSYRLREKCIKD